MGEIADMMVNGLMCQECGVWMEDHQEPGYPRTCGECQRSELKRIQVKVSCPHCGKRVAEIGLQQHVAARHAEGKSGSESK